MKIGTNYKVLRMRRVGIYVVGCGKPFNKISSLHLENKNGDHVKQGGLRGKVGNQKGEITFMLL